MLLVLHRKKRKHFKVYTVRMKTLNFNFGVTDIDFIKRLFGEMQYLLMTCHIHSEVIIEIDALLKYIHSTNSMFVVNMY